MVRKRAHMRRSCLLYTVCVAILCITAAGCRRSNDPPVAHQGGQVPLAGDSLAWSVVRAQATRHITTSTLETKDAAAGNQFVVLDVQVLNPGTQPQVVSEG